MGNYKGGDIAKSHLLQQRHEAPQVCDAERCGVHPHCFCVFWDRFDRVLTNGEASPDHSLASELKLFRPLDDVILPFRGQADLRDDMSTVLPGLGEPGSEVTTILWHQMDGVLDGSSWMRP